MSKNKNGAVADKKTDADGSVLFPMPKTPLGKACEKFSDVTAQIAKLKQNRGEVEKSVLEEMHKENRTSLTVTVGNDNWLFEVKATGEKLRCVKVTRQPMTKVTISED